MKEKEFFGKEKPWKILLTLAPPVMLAQLIQALYNIVDSFFIGKYAEAAGGHRVLPDGGQSAGGP